MYLFWDSNHGALRRSTKQIVKKFKAYKIEDVGQLTDQVNDAKLMIL